jgi:ketosteroid isomerase-like protein
MSQDNVELVRRALTAWLEGNFDPKFWAEDMEWEAAPDEPELGVARGRQAVYEAVTQFFDLVGPGHIELERLIDVGDEVLVYARWYAEGSSVGFPGYHVYTVADGTIVRVRAFLHLDQALEAVGLSE